jgi:hypothetical protein
VGGAPYAAAAVDLLPTMTQTGRSNAGKTRGANSLPISVVVVLPQIEGLTLPHRTPTHLCEEPDQCPNAMSL